MYRGVGRGYRGVRRVIGVYRGVQGCIAVYRGV